MVSIKDTKHYTCSAKPFRPNYYNCNQKSTHNATRNSLSWRRGLPRRPTCVGDTRAGAYAAGT